MPEDEVDMRNRLEVPSPLGLNSSTSSLEVRFVNVLSVFHFAQLSTFPVTCAVVWCGVYFNESLHAAPAPVRRIKCESSKTDHKINIPLVCLCQNYGDKVVSIINLHNPPSIKPQSI